MIDAERAGDIAATVDSLRSCAAMIGRCSGGTARIARIGSPVPRRVAKEDAQIAAVPHVDDMRVCEVRIVGVFHVVMHVAIERIVVIDGYLEMSVIGRHTEAGNCRGRRRLSQWVRVRLL